MDVGTEISTQPTTEPAAAPATAPAPAVTQTAGTPAEPSAYTPNFKYKYWDNEQRKQVEKEFDEWARPGIKDPDTEKRVREYFEKLNGFDSIKSHKESLLTENKTLKANFEGLQKEVSAVTQHLKKGDLESFFNALNVPEEKILRYALSRLEMREKPPEVQQTYQEFREWKSKAEQLENQNAELMQQFQQVQVATREQQLNQSLQQPAVASVVQAFNDRMGSPDAFRNEVVKRGAMYWHLHKQDKPADELVKEVAQIIGVQEAPVMSAPQTPKPVIPNIQSKGTSPAKRVPTSIKDLKSMASNMD